MIHTGVNALPRLAIASLLRSRQLIRPRTRIGLRRSSGWGDPIRETEAPVPKNRGAYPPDGCRLGFCQALKVRTTFCNALSSAQRTVTHLWSLHREDTFRAAQ